MTGNVAQVFLEDDEWAETVESVRRALRPGGSFVFESRRAEAEAWLEWNPDASFERVEIAGVGVVETWNEVVDVRLPFVTFSRHDRVPRGRHSPGVGVHLALPQRATRSQPRSMFAGFHVDAVRDAPDRPGKEYVFHAPRA